MKKIILIIGARPNFMKAFPVYEALKNDFDLTLIHTGQHFDKKMSKVFFEQLKFPRLDIHLSLEKRTKAGDYDDRLYVNNNDFLKNKDKMIEELISYDGELGQLGEIRDKLKIEFDKINPDLLIVFGDVTSTLAASIAAKSLNIDIAHVESGLRSGDIKMPEEVNRILTDHITKYYFVTEQSGVDNLKAIGITENVYLVGNTMIDTQKKYLQQALDTKYHEKMNVKSKEYVLITLHRPSNVDDHSKLKQIFDDFEVLSKKETLVYPIHPRTRNNLEKNGYLDKVKANKNIILCEPLGYLEFTCLMANCKYVVTDSGGLQEESTSLDIPCFTLRENTERPSTLIEKNGTNQLISKISEIELKPCNIINLYSTNNSSRLILYILEKIFYNKVSYKIYENKIIYSDFKIIEKFDDIPILNKIDPTIFYYKNNFFFMNINEPFNQELTVYFHGAIGKKKTLKPIFRGITNIFKKNFICFYDHTLDYIEDIYYKYFSKFNEKIINTSYSYYSLNTLYDFIKDFLFYIKKKYLNLTYIGTSAGGFNALEFATITNDNAIISNTIILNICSGKTSDKLRKIPKLDELINTNHFKNIFILVNKFDDSAFKSFNNFKKKINKHIKNIYFMPFQLDYTKKENVNYHSLQFFQPFTEKNLNNLLCFNSNLNNNEFTDNETVKEYMKIFSELNNYLLFLEQNDTLNLKSEKNKFYALNYKMLQEIMLKINKNILNIN